MNFSAGKNCRFFAVILTVLCFVSACNTEDSVETKRAFYFWEVNRSTLTSAEKKLVADQKMERLYVKFFEVEKNEEFGIYPSGKSIFRQDYQEIRNFEIVPTVYIRNEVFKTSSEVELDEFAENLLFLIEKRFEEFFDKEDVPLSEIQLDCDWTMRTKEKYFYFLRQLKSISKYKLSATLRLYPYKFPERMGVLPVDRAMLMCYNLLSPTESGDRNSILDLVELKKYVQGAKNYPIPLDLALPIYSSALIYHNDLFYGMHYVDNATLKKDLKPLKGPWYYSTKDTLLDQVYVRKGDKIKLETVDNARISAALKIIRQHVQFNSETTVALFHLQESQINNFTHEEIHSFFAPLPLSF